MSKVLIGLAVLATCVGAVAVVACVGDDPVSTTPTTTPDASTTGTPSASTTTSTTATGTSTSTPPDTDSGSTNDASTPDSGLACSFQPTTYPCGPAQQMAGRACYGDVQQCTLTACSDLLWQCNSPRQCNNTACCVPSTTAGYVSRTNCEVGALTITAGTKVGSSCEAAANCAAGEIQLCQFRADCPNGNYCAPIAVSGPASMNGQHLGVCTPDP